MYRIVRKEALRPTVTLYEIGTDGGKEGRARPVHHPARG